MSTTDLKAGAAQDAIYQCARHVGIPGEKIDAWIGTMRARGFVVSALASTETTPISNAAQDAFEQIALRIARCMRAFDSPSMELAAIEFARRLRDAWDRDQIEAAARQEPVAWVVRAKRDGSFGTTIAPVKNLMFDVLLERLKNDPWVNKGISEVVPLYAAPVPADDAVSVPPVNEVVPDYPTMSYEHAGKRVVLFEDWLLMQNIAKMLHQKLLEARPHNVADAPASSAASDAYPQERVDEVTQAGMDALRKNRDHPDFAPGLALTAGAVCGKCGFTYWEHHGHIIACPVCECNSLRIVRQWLQALIKDGSRTDNERGAADFILRSVIYTADPPERDTQK